MAEGEELPPVVATLVGNDSDFLAMLERDIEAARATATAIQDALTEGFSGVTVSGSQISGQGIGAAGEVIGEQLATGIEEGAAGLDLRPEMQGAVAGASEAGQAAGDEIAAGIADATAAGADEAGAAIADALAAGAATGADQAAAAIGASFTGPAIAQFDQTGVQAGTAFSAAFTGSANLGEAVRVSLTRASLGATLGEQFSALVAQSSITSSLTSALSDAAAEAGGAAGVELSRNLSEAAVASLSDEQFAQFTDMLVATASTAGSEAGAAAGESLGASLNTSLIGVDLIGQGLSSVGEAMTAGAQAAAQGAADAMAQVEEATLSGTQAYEAELDAVFESIWHSGQGMSVQLAAAMTEAFQGIEADTSGFTQAELAIFSEFYQTLNQMGDQAALDMAERLRLVSQAATSGGDLMASGMSTIGLPAKAATGGGAEASAASQHAAQLASENAAAMGEMGAAANGAEAAVGGLGATMGGPLMWGLLGVASMLPMVGYMFGNTTSAAQQQAQALGQLDQAISQDSNMVGANTVSTIANQLATSGAADTLKGYGISLTDATAAMAGVKSAQTDVNGTLQNQIDGLQGLITEQEAHATSSNAVIDTEKQQLAQLQATQQGMRDLESDVVNAVAQQNDLAQATLNAGRAADVFGVQVKAADLALQQQAQSANVNAQALAAYDMALIPSSQAYTDAVHNQQIALMNNAITAQINAQALNASLAPQAQLSGEAVQASLAYQQAGVATGAYTNALTAMYGQFGQASNAEAAATIAIDNLTGKVTSGKNAVDLMTDAGAKNYQIFNQAATAAEGFAEKVYEQTGDTQQADGVLQSFATKLDTAATKAHLTTAQVHELNTELFGVPDVKDIHIHLDPTPAEQQMSALRSFVQGEIADINNTTISPVVGGRPGQPRAAGGPVAAGELYIVGEEGRPEYFVPGSDGYITPMDMLTPAFATPAAAGGGFGSGFDSGGPPIVNVYVEIDGQQVTAAARAEVQNYGRRNSVTGFVGVGQ